MDDAKRAQEAKDRAQSYLHPEEAPVDETRRGGQKNESEWADIVGQRIEQAMREGVFDNLPGRGQPLNLTKDPFVPDDQQMAFKLLQNNDLRPAWISERNQVLAEVTMLRSSMATCAHWHQQEFRRTDDPAELEQLSSVWDDQIEQWATEIAALNKRIETINLQQSIPQLEIVKLRLDNELKKIGANRRLAWRRLA